MTQDLWYAVSVRSRSESLVAANLRYKGYEPFVPTYKTSSRWSDRVKVVEKPLFPGYLFCRFNVHARLPILITPGVNFIVGVGKSPEPISDFEIDGIRSVVQSGLVYEPHAYITTGQRVRVEFGALAGLTGLVTEVRSKARLVVSVNLLMRSVSVEIDRTWVEPIDARRPMFAHAAALSV